MKRFTLSFVCLLFVAVPLAPSRAQAQTANSQQTLNQYVVDLQSNPNDTALRGKIIALAQIMRPAPAIPEEARGHYVMATTFAEKVKSDTERARDSSDLKLASAGFERAVAEYKAALLAAPWWADAYKKLAIAQKAASQYDDAIASLNLYLLTQPADARDAQDEIYKIKALKQSAADDQANQARRQQEEQQRQREAQQRAYESSPAGIAAREQSSFEDLLKKIDGRKYYTQNFTGSGKRVIQVRGAAFVMGQEDFGGPGQYNYIATIPIEGRVSTSHSCGGAGCYQTFTISEDGSRITEHAHAFGAGEWYDLDCVDLWQ